MKYWLLTTEFPPIHGGGISTYCLETAEMFSANGHKVKIFIFDYSVKDVLEENVRNYQLVRFNPNRGKVSEFLGWEAKLANAYAEVIEEYIMQEGKPDYLESQDYLGIAYFIQQKSWLNYPNFQAIPIVLTLHAPSFLYLEYNQSQPYRLPNYFTGEMEKASIAMADLLISPSEFLIDCLKERNVPGLEEAQQLFNPYQTRIDSANGFKEGDLVFFGKMTPQKGCLELFEYLKGMWDKGFQKAIHVVGGGDHFFYPQQVDMQEYIQAKYKKYFKQGLIVFEGKTLKEKLNQRLATAHLVIVPSIVDNLPYAVIEAMALGKVVLASDDGGQKELIEAGENAFLFSHQRGNFAEVLQNILRLSRDEINAIGAKARSHIQSTLNAERIYQQKMELLTSLKDRKHLFPFVGRSLEDEMKLPVRKAKLSVVVPFYNLFPTLKDSLESLRNSSYENMEVLVINDGSTEEGSEEKLQELQKEYGFKLFSKSNSGLSETRNFGAEKAEGEFLAFLDADDRVEVEYYSKAIEVLSFYDNLHFVGCWAQYFGQNESVWPSFNPEPPYLLYHNMINSSALVYKKESFLKFGRNKKKMAYGMEDYESVINMVKNGARGVALPEILWNYRIRKNSMQQSFNVNKQLYLYDLIADEHVEYYRMYGAELSKLYNHNGPGYKVENPTIGPVESGRLEKFIPAKLWILIKQNTVLRRMGKAVYRRLNRN